MSAGNKREFIDHLQAKEKKQMRFTNEKEIPKCFKCGNERLVVASEHPYACFVGGTRIVRDNGTLGEWMVCTSLYCDDGKKNTHSIKVSFVSQEE